MKGLNAAIDRWLEPPSEKKIPNMEFDFEYEGFHIFVEVRNNDVKVSYYVSPLFARADEIVIDESEQSEGLREVVWNQIQDRIEA